MGSNDASKRSLVVLDAFKDPSDDIIKWRWGCVIAIPLAAITKCWHVPKIRAQISFQCRPPTPMWVKLSTMPVQQHAQLLIFPCCIPIGGGHVLSRRFEHRWMVQIVMFFSGFPVISWVMCMRKNRCIPCRSYKWGWKLLKLDRFCQVIS